MQHYRTYLLFFLSFSITCSCKSQNEEYKISRFSSTQVVDSGVVVANVRDSLGEKFIVSAVKINDKKVYQSDSHGNILITIPEGKYSFTGLRLHYSPVKIDNVKVSSGDSLVIDFFLKPDTARLYDGY